MTNPADLNDPAMAETFLRETIDNLTASIARFETEAAERLHELRQRHGDEHEDVKRYLRIVEQRSLTHVAPLKARRDELTKLIVRIEACRKATT